MSKLTEITGNIDEWDVQYRVHATKRMFQRNVDEEDVREVFLNGDIIERYEDDFPFPSVLISGRSGFGRCLHVVIGIDIAERRFYVITVYEPDPKKWTDNFSRRLE